jgi:hypothetical protein
LIHRTACGVREPNTRPFGFNCKQRATFCCIPAVVVEPASVSIDITGKRLDAILHDYVLWCLHLPAEFS